LVFGIAKEADKIRRYEMREVTTMRIPIALLAFALAAPSHGDTIIALQHGTDCAPSKEALAEINRIRATMEATGRDESKSDADFGAATDKLVAATIRTHTVMLSKHQGIKVLERGGGVQKVQVWSAVVFRAGYPAYRSNGVRVCYISGDAR
jgi:hypothetical protein